MSKKLFSIVVMVIASAGVANASQYLQASSVTQCPGTAPEVVAMAIVDAANGITLANNKITVGKAGPYLIVAAPQVGREGARPYGCFDLWLRVNGADVANSNVQLCQDEGSRAIAMGMGADTWAIDRSAEALKALWRQFGRPLDTVYSTRTAIDRHVTGADVVIGGVLIPGAAAPKLVTADMVRRMKPGSVVVDVAIDQGGCFETSHPTTHSDPTYIVDDVVHYCVANMPGAVLRTSAYALNNATLPHVLALANKGYRQALMDDPHLRNGLNVHAGEVTC